MGVAIAVFNIGFIAILAFLLQRNTEQPLKKYFWPALILKLFAGCCVGWVYLYYYSTGDTFVFFKDATYLADLAKRDAMKYVGFLWHSDSNPEIYSELVFSDPRSVFFIKILSVVNLLTNNYWLSSLYFSFASFTGAWLLVKSIVRQFPHPHIIAAIAFLFFPSAVFWSSGIIKESLAIGSLFFLSAVFLKLWVRTRIRFSEWLAVPVTCWVLWNLKYYYLAIFLPAAVTSLLVRYGIQFLKKRNFFIESLMWIGIFTVPLIAVTFLHPNFYPGRILHVVVENNAAFTSISHAEDLIHYNKLRPSLDSILLNAPWALFSGLFRPFLTEASTFFQFLVSMENFAMLVFAGFALINLRNLSKSSNRILALGVIVYISLLCIFLALSTPNFGTLARYRSAYYPFFVFLVLNENRFVHRVLRKVRSFFPRLGS